MTSAAAEAVESELEQEVLRALEETGRPMSTAQIYAICPAAAQQADVSKAIKELIDRGRLERREHLGFSLWALPGMPETTVQKPVAGAIRMEPRPAPPKASTPAPNHPWRAPMLQPPAADLQPAPADPEPTPSLARAEAAPKPVHRSEPTMSKASRGSNRDKIIQFLQKTGPAGTVEISKGTGLNTKQTGQAVWQLHAAGSITRTGKGHSSTYSVLGAKTVAAPAKATTSAKAAKKSNKSKPINGAHSLLDMANAPRFALWSTGELEIKDEDQTLVLTRDALTSMLDFLVDRAPQLQKIFGKAA